MINNTLYHEVAFHVLSGSDFGSDDSIIKNYTPLYGSFYSIVSLASEELNPTGSVLPQNYTGSIIFEIPRYKLGGTFGNFSSPTPYADNFGCNVLEMHLAVDCIGRSDFYNRPPSIFKLKTSAYNTTSDYEYTMLPSDKTYLNNVDWDWNANQQNDDKQWFGLIYDNNNQSFQLNYWFSSRTDVMLIKGSYELY